MNTQIIKIIKLSCRFIAIACLSIAIVTANPITIEGPYEAPHLCPPTVTCSIDGPNISCL